jgi:hypothetical protein
MLQGGELPLHALPVTDIEVMRLSIQKQLQDGFLLGGMLLQVLGNDGNPKLGMGQQCGERDVKNLRKAPEEPKARRSLSFLY